jgi:hypothetical protein
MIKKIYIYDLPCLEIHNTNYAAEKKIFQFI